jgi:AcrR family transcriptional regulator
MSKSGNLEKTILDAALRLAEDRSWEMLRLHDVASELDISLEVIQQHYRQKDDLVEAWYDCADTSMLKVAETEEFSSLDKDARLYRLIMTWLDTLAIHKTVSRDMLLYKLEPAHVHLQVLGLLRISRTVQWFLEAAQSKTIHLQRICEEIRLTSIYLMAFAYWMQDKSDNQQASRDYLWRRLKQNCREQKPSGIAPHEKTSAAKVRNT